MEMRIRFERVCNIEFVFGTTEMKEVRECNFSWRVEVNWIGIEIEIALGYGVQ